MATTRQRGVLHELATGARNHQLWWAFATENVKHIYRRTALGLLWVVGSYLLLLAIKVIVFGPISSKELGLYCAYVSIGLAVWFLIQRSITTASGMFIGARSWIWSTTISPTVFVFEGLAQNAITNAFPLILGLCVAAITGHFHLFGFWMIPVSLFLFAINMIFLPLYIAPICAMFRDLIFIIQNIMRAMFFLTPIFWFPEDTGAVAKAIMVYNPLYHFLVLFRDPFIYGTLPWTSLWCVLGLTIANIALGLFVYSKSRRRLAVWL